MYYIYNICIMSILKKLFKIELHILCTAQTCET